MGKMWQDNCMFGESLSAWKAKQVAYDPGSPPMTVEKCKYTWKRWDKIQRKNNAPYYLWHGLYEDAGIDPSLYSNEAMKAAAHKMWQDDCKFTESSSSANVKGQA